MALGARDSMRLASPIPPRHVSGAIKVLNPELTQLLNAERVLREIQRLTEADKLDSAFPFYNWIGVAEPNEKHIVYERGHFLPRQDMGSETLRWFDQYLGVIHPSEVSSRHRGSASRYQTRCSDSLPAP